MSFTTVIKVTETDGTVPLLTLLAGNRHDEQKSYDEIKANMKKFGIGMCTNKCKPVELYVDAKGRIYGLSTVKTERWFNLWRV